MGVVQRRQLCFRQDERVQAPQWTQFVDLEFHEHSIEIERESH